MQAQRTNRLRHQASVSLARRNFFVGVANPQPAAKIQILEIDSRPAQLAHISSQPPQRAAKWIERGNLRADVHADSPPGDVARRAMHEIQAPGLLPIQPKLVFMPPRGNM